MKLLLACLFLSFAHFPSRAEEEERRTPHPLNFYGTPPQEKQSALLTSEEATGEFEEEEEEEEGEDPSPDEEEIDDPLELR